MAQPQTSLRQNLNEPEYEYGTGGLLGAFAPVRREIISPAQSLPTGYTSTRRGVGVASDKIPAQYGEVEVDPTYAPAYRGLKSALHAIYDFGQDPMGTIRGMVQSAPEVAGSIDQYMRDQYTAGALGGTAYNPETGQVTEFDPTVAMVGGAPAGVQAVRAATPGTVTLGSAGGKIDLPPLSNAQKTQLGASTIPSYEKAGALLGGGRTLDFGAGRGQGASKIGADTFEPYPREGFNPTYTQSADIPDASYDNVTSLNVLNVMPRDVRDQTVSEIGRVLRPGGKAIVTTRGRDVMSAKGPEGPEPMSRITTSGTYQKGFTQPELREYTASVLGPDYTVDNLPEKIGQAGVMITKNPSATLRSGSKRGTGVALGSALTGSPDVRIIGGDIPEVTRDMGLLQRVGDAERVNRMNVDWEPAQFNEVPILNAQDLEGRGYASTMVDTTRSGLERVAAINGVEIPYGVQHGGAFFGFQPENMKRKAIFANTGAGDVSTIFNKARAGQMLGGISPNADRGTVFVPYGLTGLSPDFATMGLDLMVPYAQQVMSPASKKALDKRIRDGVKSKKGSEFQGVSDWPGIDSPNISKYLSGIGGKRKNIGKALDEFGFGEGEGLTLSEARAIITEPSMFRPRFGDLNAAYGMDLSMGVGINPDHPTYGSEFYGSPLGAFRVPANIFDMNPRFRDIRDQKWVMEEERKKGRVQPNPKAVAGGMFGVFDQPTLDYLIGINAINP